jgi:hypothetical protein
MCTHIQGIVYMTVDPSEHKSPGNLTQTWLFMQQYTVSPEEYRDLIMKITQTFQVAMEVPAEYQ